MLPLTVLRRFDCVLAEKKDKVVASYERNKGKHEGAALDAILNRVSGQKFHNKSPLDFAKLKGDPDNIDQNLIRYIESFSENVRRIFEYFEFTAEIEKMRESNILYLVISKFADIDLAPPPQGKVENKDMGLAFENLIRRFNELANETAGDHFTPREVIHLMVHLLFSPDDDLLTKSSATKMLDPACGTGGMLAEAQKYMNEHNPDAFLYTYGQDYNKRAFATAASDMLIKEVAHNGAGENIQYGDSLIDDQFEGHNFDYLIANPPFGVDWKKQQKEIKREHEKLGFAGRFGAGTPRVNDGSLLFLQHMISKFEPNDPKRQKNGSRLAIVFSGSPLFTGGAGSGESNIRKWIIENDWLEGIVALPEQMFYNTGIGTYVWLVTNRKEKKRKGKVLLYDARELFIPMKRSLGDKRRKIGEGPDADGGPEPDQISEIVKGYGNARANGRAKIFKNEEFGYTRVTVERPLRLRYRMTVEDKARFLDAVPHLLDDVQAIDKQLGRKPLEDWNAVDRKVRKLIKANDSKWKASEYKLFRDVFTTKEPEAEPVKASGKKKSPYSDYEPDTSLRDFENVPLTDDIEDYFEREVRPYVADAWMEREKDTVGYEINFNRYFYEYLPPRPLAEIDAELKQAEEEILRLLKEVTT
ncbi:Type I restriction enzyme EcoKI M protein [Adhaeretor mobilis]|uniref:site-specific DNA-methyltransferase (adenine-specific) n=2 Tax=Adhaeretor mobilis TaxID=1930276 RepID=A0A517MWS0_9BACT|nr:Type I restriction enzyme EcoKI M protein [Adhaeretor mobilis]